MAVADELFAAALPTIPPDIYRQQMFCDGRNWNCQAFAARHRFKLSNELAIMALGRADLGHVPRATALPIDERYYDQFRHLHPRLMPNTYFTAQQLLDRLDSELASADRDPRGRMLGYVYFQAGQRFEGYIDFVAVAETARRRGSALSLSRQPSTARSAGLTSTLSGSL